jgi:hypothetical protein
VYAAEIGSAEADRDNGDDTRTGGEDDRTAALALVNGSKAIEEEASPAPACCAGSWPTN